MPGSRAASGVPAALRALGIVVALALVALLAAPSLAEARKRRVYCSPTGDYCVGAQRKRGKVFLRISTFSFTGRYKLCVRTPRGTRTCKVFGLRRTSHGLYSSSVRWRRHFPDDGRGLYRARWYKFGSGLGPQVFFRF